jgi:Zn-dependent peptidase ImmA (M78 family)
MIFEDLDEALENLNERPVYDIDHFIKDFEIKVHYTDTLTDNINGYTIPMTKTLFINNRAPAKLFVKCHEFTHCLLDSNSEPLIETSYMIGSRIEHRADMGALTIMVQQYVTNGLIEPHEFSVTRFQQDFGLHSKYLYDIAAAAERVLGVPFDL